LLRALKLEAVRPRDPWRLTAIVTVADDGGSSGRLRKELGGLPPGDLRACLSALSGETSILAELLAYRFGGEGPLAGHALGNLMLLAAADLCGGWAKGLRLLGEVLVTAGRLVPSTAVPVTLWAEGWCGERYDGEVAVHQGKAPFSRIGLEPRDPEPLPEALLAILQADVILLAPGSLYTSILPNLLIPELRRALQRASAPRIYVANLVPEAGETEGFDLADHVAVLQAVGGFGLDGVLADDECMRLAPDAVRAVGSLEGAPSARVLGVPLWRAPLRDPTCSVARHEPIRLNRALHRVVAELGTCLASESFRGFR